MATMTTPERTEAADYYFTYIDKVGRGDICETLEAQMGETAAFLRGISDERSLHRYAPDKWSIRQVVGHLNDAERVFAFRAFWFARGFDSSLPSFEQDIAVTSAGSDARSWPSLIDEFQTVRAASLSLFNNLPADAWMRRGTASGNPFTVRALAYIVAGHVAHHVGVVRERYL
jgi:hypothetical protein